MSTALRTAGLTRRFGALAAVSDVSLALERGARHALIGPNGAGKTTLVNLLSGAIDASAGEIYLGADRITRLAPHERVKRGLARTFQVASLFPGFTVLESAMAAVLERKGLGARFAMPLQAWKEERQEAMDLLCAFHLAPFAEEAAASLPYGRQRLLDIALALATRPRILLLDEPAAGIPADDAEDILRALSALPAEVTVLLVEHDMALVFRFAERITVMAEGEVLADGTPEAIAADARVRAVYLGERTWAS